MITSFQQLTNAGSKNMNVNGVTPKTFSYSPGGSKVAAVTGISCILRNEGTTSLNKFGALTALTNGVLIQATINGSTTTIATIKDNADLSTIFHYNQYGNSAALSLLGVVTPEGFGNSNNIFVGFLDFDINRPILLTGSDSISVIIQDNLSTIDNFQITCKIATD